MATPDTCESTTMRFALEQRTKSVIVPADEACTQTKKKRLRSTEENEIQADQSQMKKTPRMPLTAPSTTPKNADGNQHGKMKLSRDVVARYFLERTHLRHALLGSNINCIRIALSQQYYWNARDAKNFWVIYDMFRSFAST
jgi:hypothetical protein